MRRLREVRGWAPRRGLTLVDGVLGQLAELGVDDPRVGAQKLLLAGRQLQGETATVRASAPAPAGPSSSNPWARCS